MKLRSLAAVALLAPAIAFAAPQSSTKSAKSGAKPEAAASSSSSSRTAGTPLDGLEVGGFIGYETDDVSGLSLRFDGELPFRQLTPQLKMSLVGSLGFNYLTTDSFGGAKLSTYSLYVVPAARFTMPLNEQFDVFGDAGLGLAYVHGKLTIPSVFGFGGGEFTDSTINLMMRLGVGAWYHVNPQLKVGALIEFDPVFGDYGFSSRGGAGGSQSFFNIQVGAMFRM